MFSLPEAAKPPPPKETYPWSYDEDVISTQASIKEGEKLTNEKLTDEGAIERSMNMIDSYDNNRRVWERNMPYGNTWGLSTRSGRPETAPQITSPPAGDEQHTFVKNKQIVGAYTEPVQMNMK